MYKSNFAEPLQRRGRALLYRQGKGLSFQEKLNKRGQGFLKKLRLRGQGFLRKLRQGSKLPQEVRPKGCKFLHTRV